jgi:hypothetical protein
MPLGWNHPVGASEGARPVSRARSAAASSTVPYDRPPSVGPDSAAADVTAMKTKTATMKKTNAHAAPPSKAARRALS